MMPIAQSEPEPGVAALPRIQGFSHNAAPDLHQSLADRERSKAGRVVSAPAQHHLPPSFSARWKGSMPICATIYVFRQSRRGLTAGQNPAP